MTFCTEAQYAFNKGKEIIPLLLEAGYQPDVWLDPLFANNQWFNFSVPEEFENSWRMLHERLNVVMSDADIRDTGLYVHLFYRKLLC